MARRAAIEGSSFVVRSLLGRAVWSLLLVLVAVGAVGVQMDREARRSTAVAFKVPAFARGFALETLARGSYNAGDVGGGLAFSRELIARRPIPAEGLALYANGLIATQQTDAALAPVLLAAQRGWHDRFTQRIMVSLALNNGEWTVAAQRLLALWRLGYEDEDDVRDLSQAALADPRAVTAFAQGIGPGEQWWIARFLLWAAGALPAKSVAELAAAARTKGASYNCDAFAGSAQRLLGSGKVDAVTALWRETCGVDGMTAPNDLKLKQVTAPGPFDWSFPDDAGLTSQLEDDNGGMVLRYQNTDPVRSVIATRYLALAPGGWRVRVDPDAGSGVDGKALLVRVRCGGQVLQFEGGRYVTDGGDASIVVPEQCPAQQIEILASRGKGVLRAVMITR